MIVEQKPRLAKLQAFCQLRLGHTAIVRAYECHPSASAMTVNRLLLVFRDEGPGNCVVRNPHADQEFPMRPGGLYFIPCNLPVEVHINPSISFVSLHFNLDLFYGFDVFDRSLRCETRTDPDQVLAAKAALESGDELRSVCWLNALLFELCSAWLPPDTAERQNRLLASRRYAEVLDHVRRSGDATTTVESLAERMGQRPDVFSRTFTRDLGMTPKDFLTQTLMRKASRMLLAPGITVRAVADELHFSSEYYFSRFFKKHSGQSPTAFRHAAGAHAPPTGSADTLASIPPPGASASLPASPYGARRQERAGRDGRAGRELDPA